MNKDVYIIVTKAHVKHATKLHNFVADDKLFLAAG